MHGKLSLGTLSTGIAIHRALALLIALLALGIHTNVAIGWHVASEVLMNKKKYYPLFRQIGSLSYLECSITDLEFYRNVIMPYVRQCDENGDQQNVVRPMYQRNIVCNKAMVITTPIA